MAVRRLNYAKQQRRLARARASEKTLTESRIEVYLLSFGGDASMQRVVELLRDMSSAERRSIREALQKLDAALDDISIELRARRR